MVRPLPDAAEFGDVYVAGISPGYVADSWTPKSFYTVVAAQADTDVQVYIREGGSYVLDEQFTLQVTHHFRFLSVDCCPTLECAYSLITPGPLPQLTRHYLQIQKLFCRIQMSVSRATCLTAICAVVVVTVVVDYSNTKSSPKTRTPRLVTIT